VQDNRSIPTATVVPVLVYPDVRAAVAWLTDVFGFRERLRIGESHRSQLNVGADGAVIVCDVRHDQVPPTRGAVASYVMVRVDDVHAHHRHSVERGANVLMEPTDFEYGERQYSVEDLAGHHWMFTETLADVHPSDFGCELIGG
jgi:uncharacterized glyoxalase superfamily protein PhnB